MKPTYDWNRHHAWGGLGILSLFSGLHALTSIPPWITYPVGSVLVIYVVTFLYRTYRSAGELRGENTLPAPNATTVMNKAQATTPVTKSNRIDGIPSPDATTVVNKAQAKIEKKRLKAEEKREKKSGKEE